MISFSTLRPGAVGPETELLQTGLIRAGFLSGEVDGIFGKETLAALRRFQQSVGLTPDGVAGPATWHALYPYLTGYVLYMVQPGDTLYRIAERYGTALHAMETANPKVDPFRLSVGSHLTVPLPFEVVPINIRFTSDVLALCVEGLRARYPFLGAGTVGNSVMGKPIPYLTMGAGENQVLFNGTHHANEWITSMLLMKYLENYAAAYAREGKIAGTDAGDLARKTSLFVVPMVNPDGVDLVTGRLSSGTYYEQAVSLAEGYPDIPFPNGWKANIAGIDPNLQYPAGWENAREIKYRLGYTKPGPRDFVGPAPLAAPESRSLYQFTLAHNFSITLSYHSQGEVIYWKYLDYLPENSYQIAQQFGEVSGYTVELVPPESTYAGYKDWFILRYDRPGYTIEVGKGASPLPLSQFPKIYGDNEGLLTLALSVTA